MKSESIETDVVIAGGGPCGLMLANELGRRGVRCLLVDPKPGTAFNPQANATQARTMEHFRRLGFADEVRAQGLPADHPTDIAYFTRYAAHELARLRLPTAADAVLAVRKMTGSWSAAELPHRISQKYVEAILRRHAEALPSNDVRYGWELSQFSELSELAEAAGKGDAAEASHPIRAVVRPVGSTSAEVHVRARYLVGADGPRSLVRRSLGIEWGGSTGAQRDFMGGKMFAVYLRAPAFAEVVKKSPAWMYVAVNHERRAFMAAVDGVSEFAFHAAVHPGEDADAWTAQDAQRIFNQAVGAEVPIEVLSVGTWTAGHSLVARSFQRGRVFIAGDAAHLFTPTGGLGYNTAIEDAVNLGWKLAGVIRGNCAPALLQSYEAERRPVAERNTGYARQFADSVGLYSASALLESPGTEGDAERVRASAHLDAHARLEFNIPGVTFGARYDASPVIVHDDSKAPPDAANNYTPTAKPGGRAPHAWLPDGTSLFDAFNFEWTLLFQGTDAATEKEAAAFVEAARAFGLDLRAVGKTSPELQAFYEAPMILIRPDQIVAWRGSDAANASAVLARVTGRVQGEA